MTILQIVALVSALQSDCPRCPQADVQAIYEAAQKHSVPEQVLIWTAFFESSLNVNAIGKRGEIGPVQIMPRGVNARKCSSFDLALNTWDCAALIVAYEWRGCGGDWICFWKTHACGTNKTKCGDKISKNREWIRRKNETSN